MAGMGQSRNGNGGGQRGQAQRPGAAAPDDKEPVGEELIKRLLASRKGEIKALFARDEDPDASFQRAVAFAVGGYRKCQNDAKEGVVIDEFSAAATSLWAMQRKLDPGTDVYLVPYKGKVTPIISPQGVIKLAFRSGFVLAIDARAVFRGEKFDYQLGSERWIKHQKGGVRPINPVEAWNLLEFAYCTVHLKGGGPPVMEVLDKADITYYRSLSQTGQYESSMWGKFPWEAARKTALKQGLKCVPQESEISAILEADDTERGIPMMDEIWDALKVRGVVPKAPQEPTREELEERAVTAANDQQRSLPAPPKDLTDEQLRAFIRGEEIVLAPPAESTKTAS
jgi:recombinational DNA repair protein RecT